MSFLSTGRIASEWGIVLSSLGCLSQDFLNMKFTVVNFKVNPSVSSDIHIWVNFPSEPPRFPLYTRSLSLARFLLVPSRYPLSEALINRGG